MAAELGLIIPAESPAPIARRKNDDVITSLCGSPNEMLDTPSTVLPPCSLILLTVSSVTLAELSSVLIVMVRASITISFLLIPYFAAVLYIFSAMASLPSAVDGIPSSSRARPTTTPPYFWTRGNIFSITSCFPLTELTIAFPLYILNAASIAAGSVVSICRGRGRIL